MRDKDWERLVEDIRNSPPPRRLWGWWWSVPASEHTSMVTVIENRGPKITGVEVPGAQDEILAKLGTPPDTRRSK